MVHRLSLHLGPLPACPGQIALATAPIGGGRGSRRRVGVSVGPAFLQKGANDFAQSVGLRNRDNLERPSGE